MNCPVFFFFSTFLPFPLLFRAALEHRDIYRIQGLNKQKKKKKNYGRRDLRDKDGLSDQRGN